MGPVGHGAALPGTRNPKITIAIAATITPMNGTSFSWWALGCGSPYAP
jgi:hypothetical protein